ncbi:hypothetical protein N8639_02280 [bacterium]|nr:hypothetical protein [bacterium]
MVAIIGLLSVYALTQEPGAIFTLLAALILPVACIWFPDELGTVTGISLGLGQPQISEPTPGIVVAIGGWILLLTITIAVIANNW